MQILRLGPGRFWCRARKGFGRVPAQSLGEVLEGSGAEPRELMEGSGAVIAVSW